MKSTKTLHKANKGFVHIKLGHNPTEDGWINPNLIEVDKRTLEQHFISIKEIHDKHNLRIKVLEDSELENSKTIDDLLKVIQSQNEMIEKQSKMIEEQSNRIENINKIGELI